MKKKWAWIFSWVSVILLILIYFLTNNKFKNSSNDDIINNLDEKAKVRISENAHEWQNVKIWVYENGYEWDDDLWYIDWELADWLYIEYFDDNSKYIIYNYIDWNLNNMWIHQ